MYASPKLWEKEWIKLNKVESALRVKGIACVRASNLFAILSRNAGSLATESSVLSLQRLMETTHFSERLTRTVSSVTSTRHSFNFCSAFSFHAYTTILILFWVSFIPIFLFQVSVAGICRCSSSSRWKLTLCLFEWGKCPWKEKQNCCHRSGVCI